jgi:hypothetical protein
MVMHMKEDDDTHSLDTWTSLCKATSDLLSKLRCQAQPDSKLREQAQSEMQSCSEPEPAGKPAQPNSDVTLERHSTRFFKRIMKSQRIRRHRT